MQISYTSPEFYLWSIVFLLVFVSVWLLNRYTEKNYNYSLVNWGNILIAIGSLLFFLMIHLISMFFLKFDIRPLFIPFAVALTGFLYIRTSIETNRYVALPIVIVQLIFVAFLFFLLIAIAQMFSKSTQAGNERMGV